MNLLYTLKILFTRVGEWLIYYYCLTSGSIISLHLMNNKIVSSLDNFIFYTTPNGDVKLEVFFTDESLWLSQKMIAKLFAVDVRTINEHLQNIYITNELSKDSTIRNFRIVQKEGGRSVNRDIDFYNLDAIISVGYRVNSQRATQFRIWATNTLKEYIVKGFVLDDGRLKQGEKVFGKDYFKELLDQCNGSKVRYGNITEKKVLLENMKMNCIPESIFEMELDEYDEFLEQRRKLIAEKIKKYYFSL